MNQDRNMTAGQVHTVKSVAFIPFDLKVGDIIKIVKRLCIHEDSEGIRYVDDDSRYRVDTISDMVILTTKVTYDFYNGAWKDLYREGFMKLDYMQGLIKRVENDC